MPERQTNPSGVRLFRRMGKAVFGCPFYDLPKLLPGAALAILVATLSLWFAQYLGNQAFAHATSPVSPVMIALLVGLLIGNTLRLPRIVHPGLGFAAGKVMKLGIILLGIRLSIFDVLRFGATGVPIVVVCIVGALVLTGLLSFRLSIPKRLGTLIAVGTSICGVSAIVAAGPSIEADPEEVAYAVAVITVFGMIATLVYPYLAYELFAGDAVKVGLFLGTAVHDTSQVTGAAMVYADVYSAPQALDAAIVVKLVRNVFMVVVLPLVALFHARTSARGTGKRTVERKVFPVFVLGFLALAAIRAIGDAGLHGSVNALGMWNAVEWVSMIGGVKHWAINFLVVALAGVGLTARFRNLAKLGWRPFVVGFVAAVLVGAISFVGITLLGSLLGGVG